MGALLTTSDIRRITRGLLPEDIKGKRAYAHTIEVTLDLVFPSLYLLVYVEIFNKSDRQVAVFAPQPLERLCVVRMKMVKGQWLAAVPKSFCQVQRDLAA